MVNTGVDACVRTSVCSCVYACLHLYSYALPSIVFCILYSLICIILSHNICICCPAGPAKHQMNVAILCYLIMINNSFWIIVNMYMLVTSTQVNISITCSPFILFYAIHTLFKQSLQTIFFKWSNRNNILFSFTCMKFKHENF